MSVSRRLLEANKTRNPIEERLRYKFNNDNDNDDDRDEWMKSEKNRINISTPSLARVKN